MDVQREQDLARGQQDPARAEKHPDEGHHYLAFDLGASSGRALIGTLDGDRGPIRMHVDEVHRFEMPIIEDGARLFWDLEELEHQIDEGLRRGLEAAPELRSLSIDSWAVDYVPLGHDGTPLRNPYCYRDPRTKGVMEDALERIAAEEIYETTGIQFMPINTLYQVLADLEMEPELVRQTRLRLPIADYLLYRLCGRPVVERTMASTTQLMNVRTHAWATDLMERFGIDTRTWPEIVPPATRLGPMRKGVVSGRQDPTHEITVVAGCSHDTACAVAAVPAEDDGAPWAYLSCGTWALLGVERKEPILTQAACDESFTNESGLDSTVRFLKNLTGLWVLQECERAWRADGRHADYDALQREAAAAPSRGETADLTDPRFAERGDMPQKLRAYCREHGLSVPGRRGEFVRLILESMAADCRDKLAVLEDLIGHRIERLHIVGGGSQNELLCQWTADATGRSVVAGPAEATGLGNLLIQARTMGALPAGTSIRDVVRAGAELRTYEPVRNS